MTSIRRAIFAATIICALLLGACGRPEQANHLAPLAPASGAAPQPVATATATASDIEPTLKPEYQTDIALGIYEEFWDGWTPPPMSPENAAIETQRADLNKRAQMNEQTAQARPSVVLPTRRADYVDPTIGPPPSVPPGPMVQQCDVEMPKQRLRALNCWGWTLHGEEIVILAGFEYRRSSEATAKPSTKARGGVAIRRFTLDDSGLYILKGDVYWTPDVTGELKITDVAGTQVALRAYDNRLYTFDLESHAFSFAGTAPPLTPTP
jgi:hypothetical protein